MAAIRDYLAEDWEVMDDPRTVTYHARLPGGGFAAPVTVGSAVRRAVGQDDAAFLPEALLAQVLTVWHLWREKLGGVVPRNTDVVQEGAARWVVQRADEVDEGERYRLVCQRER